MIGLIVVFFIAAPAVVLYTAGYRYNWQLHRFDQAGVLSVDIEPLDAHVFIDAHRIPKELPIRLTTMIPGTYTLRMEAKNKKTWEKDIVIESKKTTYIKNITLFEDASPALFMPEKETITSFSSSVQGQELFLMTRIGTSTYEGTIVQTDTKKTAPIGRYVSDKLPHVLWSSQAPFIAVQTRQNGIARIEIIDAEHALVLGEHTFSATINHLPMQWSLQSGTPMLYVEDGVKIKKILERTVEQFAVIPSNTLWHVDTIGDLWLFDEFHHTLSPAEHPTDIVSVANGQTVLSIIDINTSRAIFETTQGIIVRDASDGTEQTLPASFFFFNPVRNEWIAWSLWELWTIYDNGGVALLNRVSEKTAQVLPLDEYGVLLLATDTSLTAFNPGYYVSQLLLSAEKIEHIALNQETRTIFFLGTIGGARGIFSLAF